MLEKRQIAYGRHRAAAPCHAAATPQCCISPRCQEQPGAFEYPGVPRNPHAPLPQVGFARRSRAIRAELTVRTLAVTPAGPFPPASACLRACCTANARLHSLPANCTHTRPVRCALCSAYLMVVPAVVAVAHDRMLAARQAAEAQSPPRRRSTCAHCVRDRSEEPIACRQPHSAYSCGSGCYRLQHAAWVGGALQRRELGLERLVGLRASAEGGSAGVRAAAQCTHARRRPSRRKSGATCGGPRAKWTLASLSKPLRA